MKEKIDKQWGGKTNQLSLKSNSKIISLLEPGTDCERRSCVVKSDPCETKYYTKYLYKYLKSSRRA